MGTFETLKNDVKALIKENGAEEITGLVMQGVLLNIIDNLGLGATFAGVANLNTNPISTDQNLFYIAASPGTYQYFNNITLTDKVLIFTNRTGVWVSQNTGIKILNIQQSTGNSQVYVMSQKAVTDALNSLSSTLTQEINKKISDVTDDISSGISSERVKGTWVKRTFYADGDLGLLQSINDSDKVQQALGDFDVFSNAVANGLYIYCAQYTKSGHTYQTNIPISYSKRDDLGYYELSWIVGNIRTYVSIDVAGGWGDILEFKQLNYNDIDQTKLFQVRILEATNFHSTELTNADNFFSVKLDKPLPEGYHIVFLRRKKVKYKSTLNRDARNKGIRYCLVVGSENGGGGYIGSSYRGRVAFIQNMEFQYNEVEKKYTLRKKTGELISAYDFAKHYTEYDTEKNVLRVSTAGGCKYLKPITGMGTENMIKIQFAVAVVRYYGKNQDSGFIVCSNLAKVNFGFANNRRGERIDISTESGLYKGFQVFVKN